ncbi:hypothetical protein JY651_21380 [Pyxidicoccus parkwayensis]|uniref:Uncharacterized protein n=1 Tax=Pyxidicoccus parkwayensis TaxID=2813578 RepID=A0ABX7PA16_9BACT|nr:hypothetical protein [Pyxidicoccus parkwaysis]QSQ27303.1 hypothetical protein JY651_21380 [Pyxidicoccus parkwaysis]
MSSTLESYELIRFAEAFEARLATAGEMLAGRPGLEAEKRWLADALELVRTTRAPSSDVLDRVKDLPELEEAREEYAFHQLGLWVDALEKLHAGITFTASSRAPVIEALFPHVKFPQLRRAPRDSIIEYATSYERRTKSSYVTRIFARDDFALVRPVMEKVTTAFTEWRSSHEPAPLSPEVESVLREELVALGRKLDVALRQARLLSEAAMVPVPSVYEAAGLNLKPKRRAGRGLGPTAEEALAGFGEEPVDSMEPTEAELAEVAALDAGTSGAEDAEAPVAGSPVPAEATGAVAEESSSEAEGGSAVDERTDAEGASESAASTGEAELARGAEGASGTAEAPAPTDGATSATPDVGASSSVGEGGGARNATPKAAVGSAPEDTAVAATARGRASAATRPPAPDEAVVKGASRDGATAPTSAPGSDDSSPAAESGGESRGARKGRKKAEVASAPSEGEAPAPAASTEAQAPRVRKKKATPAPDASGSETP